MAIQKENKSARGSIYHPAEVSSVEKRRIVKDDGRYLIFYSFPKGSTKNDQGRGPGVDDTGAARSGTTGASVGSTGETEAKEPPDHV